MKKIIAIAIVALISASAMAADTVGTVTYRKANLTKVGTSGVWRVTASNGRVTEPVLLVAKVTGAVPSTMAAINVAPVGGTPSTYVVKAGTALSNTTSTIVLNDYSDSTSAKCILLAGDVLSVTGSAAFAESSYYMVVKETVQ